MWNIFQFAFKKRYTSIFFKSITAWTPQPFHQAGCRLPQGLETGSKWTTLCRGHTQSPEKHNSDKQPMHTRHQAPGKARICGQLMEHLQSHNLQGRGLGPRSEWLLNVISKECSMRPADIEKETPKGNYGLRQDYQLLIKPLEKWLTGNRTLVWCQKATIHIPSSRSQGGQQGSAPWRNRR